MTTTALNARPLAPRIMLIIGKLVVLAAITAAWIGASATAGHALRWRYGVDARPQQIAPNAWHFSISLKATPRGQVYFASSQYDFAGATNGMVVTYDFTQNTSGYTDSRSFLTVAPTLFEPADGYMNGWDAADLQDGTFSGVVYSTARLTAVHFYVEADSFARPRRHR